jgi:subtilisin family serine protease
MRRLVSTFAAAAVALLVGTTPLAAQEAPAEVVLVTYASSAATDRAVAPGGDLDDADPEAQEIATRVAVAELTEAEVAAVAASPGVLAVEPDQVVDVAEVPNDPCYASPSTCGGLGSWQVDRVGLPAAWDVSHGTGVVVAVVDTGVTPIPELAGKVLPEINASGGQPCLTGSRAGHGTAAAALIGALTNNADGIPGAGWDAQIRPVRVWAGPSCDGGTSLSAVINGIAAARDSGARIINLSLTTNSATALRAVIDDVINSGAVVVAAAGNSGSADPAFDQGGYPAAYPNVLSVGATCPAASSTACSGAVDARASFSNFGPWVDLFAPGAGLVSFDHLGSMVSVSGTSFSAPIVAGVVALVRAVQTSITPAQVQDLLVRAADPVGGLLRLDAAGALNDLAFGASPPVGSGAADQSAAVTTLVARSFNGQPWTRAVAESTAAGATRWSVLDGLVRGDPDVADLGGGAVAVVVRGVDDGAYTRTRSGGTWSAWINLGGGFTSDLTVVAQPNQLLFAGRGLDGAIWISALSGSTFSGWSTLGGSLTSEPELASIPGRIDVFARGLDGAMWQRAFIAGAWQSWRSLGGGFRAGPGAMATAGVEWVAARGLDDQIWVNRGDGSTFTGWVPLGGTLVSSTEVSAAGPGTVSVYARGIDQRLWRNRGTSAGFTGWVPVS